MGQGQDKIARSLVDLQPTAIVELFLLYFNTVDKENAFIAFHGGANFTSSIKWQGIDYIPLPVESEGFEVSANGQMARPKIRISNKDYFMTDLLANNQDLQFAKIFRKRTFVKYLDDDNFDGGNPWGQADSSAEISNDTFVISQKTSENKIYVEFELSSPLDLENFEVNNRLIMSRYCSWYYRGNGCNYNGPPIETEDGRSLYINNNNLRSWGQIRSNANWKTGVSYVIGDAVFLENKKIIINKPSSSSTQTSEYAKIWYVCNQGHVSTLSNQPDLNQTFWTRDGCNKKLDGCKKRFQDSENMILPSLEYSVNNYYTDFSNLPYYSSNVSDRAEISASSYYKSGYSRQFSFENVRNKLLSERVYPSLGFLTDSDNRVTSWLSQGYNPWIQFKFATPTVINSIDIYDIKGSFSNFNNAQIYYLYENGSVDSSILPIDPNGIKTSTGFQNKIVTGVIISGVGTTFYAGLDEIQIFSPSLYGLYNESFKNDQIFLKEDFHIATCLSFPKGRNNSFQTSVFHNVRENNWYQGINLHITDNNVILDFSTIQLSGNPAQYTEVGKYINIPFLSSDSLKYLHVECYGGKTNDISPTFFPEGVIKISDQNGNSASYTLKNKDALKNFSGEFFTFKNPYYTGGVGDLFFGVKNANWQTAPPISFLTPYPVNKQITSNFRLGATAIWTGRQGAEDRKEFFNRSEDSLWEPGSLHSAPRTYQELINYGGLLPSGLYAWWDMDMSTNISPYGIISSNNASRILNFSGDSYIPSTEFSEQKSFNGKSVSISQEPLGYLPFGGFPATDKYGR